MTRVPTFSQSALLLSEFSRIQDRIFQAQQQVSTGKKAQSYKEIASDAAGLLAAKGVKDRLAQYVRVGGEVAGRLEIQNLHLETLADAGARLRTAVTDALANNTSLGLMEEVRSIFNTATSVLNATYGSQYLYAGTRTDTPPVTVTDFAGLLATASAGDIFGNDQVKAAALIDESLPMEYGLLASELGTELMASLKRIGEFDAGPSGPLTGDLSAAQQSFLEGELANVKQLIESLNRGVGENGLRQQEVERTLAAQKDAEIVLTGFISDIEDVDLAEAVTRLQNDQTALEAAARVFGTLKRSSLLDFLVT